MKTKTLSLLAALALAVTGGSAFAAVNDYQVTGPVVEVTDSMIVVQVDGKSKWELKKDASTKGEAKVGDKVTIKYTMTATKIENKGAAAAAKKDEKKEEKKK